MLRVLLRPQRAHTGTAGEDHFRRAESQFFRMLGGVPTAGSVKPEAVEYCYAPPLVAAYEAKRAAFDAQYGRGGHTEVLLFHGTPKDASVESIVTGGFDLSKVGSTTDAGLWGAAIYLSEMTAMSLAYARSCGKMLMCRVLLGKPFLVQRGQRSMHGMHLHGKPCVPGYDSHVVDLNFSEVVIFQSAQILLMCYIIHLTPPAPPPAMAAAFGGAFAMGMPMLGGMLGGGVLAAAAGGGGAAGGSGPLGGVAGMSATYTGMPKKPSMAAQAQRRKEVDAEAAEMLREARDTAAAEARKRQRAADEAAEAADLERAMKLSAATAGAADDFEAQLARAMEASRATAAAERTRAARW